MIIELDDSVSIFDTGAQVLVNPVNCLASSGRGLAADFSSRFPENQMRLMEKKNLLGKLIPGNVYWFKPSTFPLIANMTTKDHWRQNSRMEWLQDGIITLHDSVDLGIKSIAIPRVGCGLGKLDWQELKPFVLQVFQDVDYDVFIWR